MRSKNGEETKNKNLNELNTKKTSNKKPGRKIKK